MKRYTSKFLKSVALVYMAFPVSYLLYAALLFDIPARSCVHLLLSFSYYVLSALAIVAGYGLWEMRRWSWYIFLISSIFIGYNNALLVSSVGESHHKLLAFLFSVFTLIALLLRVSREIRVPYFLPKIRWWESNPRFRLTVPVTVQRLEKDPLHGEILDLSMGGCFIKVRTDLAQDEALQLKFQVFGQVVEPVGTVVWKTLGGVTHPMGVGVKFGPLPRNQRRIMKAVTLRLKDISHLYRTSRYLMSQEDFFKKMENLRSSDVQLRRDRKSARRLKRV